MKSLPLTLTDTVLKPSRVAVIARRDGTVYRHTEGQASVTISSNTYSPIAGLTISAIKHTLGGQPASVQIDLAHALAGTFKTADLDAGRFDGATVTIGVYDRSNPTSIGTMFTGTVQPYQYDIDGSASLDVRGLATDRIGVFTMRYQPMCRFDLGDSLCRVPILPADVARSTAYVVGDFARVRFSAGGTPDDYANRYLECTTGGTTAGSAPSFSSTVDATTADGTVVWTTRNAWTRYGRIATIENQHTITLTANPDSDRGADNWFNQGVFVMRSGDNSGWAYEIGDWTQSSLKLISYLPMGNLVALNDWLEIWPGCNKTLDSAGCPRFFNQANFGGEGHFLGVKAVAASQNTGVNTL